MRTLNFQRSKFFFSFLRLLAFDLFGSFCKISLCAGKLSENEKLSISTETLIHVHSLHLKKKKNGFEIIHNQWPVNQLKHKLHFQLWYKNSIVCCLLHSRGSGEGGHFSLWHCLFLQYCVLTAKMCNTSIYLFWSHWRHQRKSTWPKIWLCNRMCFRSLLWSFAVASWRWSEEAGSHFSIRLFRHLNPNPTFDNTQIQNTKFKDTKIQKFKNPKIRHPC